MRDLGLEICRKLEALGVAETDVIDAEDAVKA